MQQLEQKINIFLEIISKSRKTAGFYENGLIIFENESESHIDRFKNDNRFIYLEEGYNYISLIKCIIAANKEGKIAMILIDQDINSKVLSLLKQLSEGRKLTVFDYSGQDVQVIELKESFNLLVCAKRSVIENKISYPYFYSLFGPILSL